jgi:hypothetical protein
MSQNLPPTPLSEQSTGCGRRIRRKHPVDLSGVALIPFVQVAEGPAPEEPWVRCISCRANVSQRLAQGRYCAPCLTANAHVGALPLLPELWQLVARAHLLPFEQIPLRLVCRGLHRLILPVGPGERPLSVEALRAKSWVLAWCLHERHREYAHLETKSGRAFRYFGPRVVVDDKTRERMVLMAATTMWDSPAFEEERWYSYSQVGAAPAKFILSRALRTGSAKTADILSLLARIPAHLHTNLAPFAHTARNWGHIEVADVLAPNEDPPASWWAVLMNCRYGRPEVVRVLLHHFGHVPHRTGILEWVCEAAGHGHLPVLDVLGELLPWAFGRDGLRRRKMFTWFTEHKVGPGCWAWFARVFPVTTSARKRLRRLGPAGGLSDCALVEAQSLSVK